jgi:hypothetical protein
MIAVVIILVRIIITTPFGKGVMEGFKTMSVATPVNTMTECPGDSKMYMYGGTSFCCNGIVNPDADDIQQTCSLQWQRGSGENVFCTLGPERNGIKNCLETRAGLMQAKGETTCPPSLPNFCQGSATTPTANGRCCQGLTNEQITDCMNTSANTFCDVTTAENEFTVPTSCQFLRDQQEAGSCPTGYSATTTAFTTGTFTGMTLFGCTNNSSVCYQPSLLQRLKTLGIDTSSLTACPSSGSSGSGSGSSS